MKRFFSLILSLSLILGLTACGGGPESTEELNQVICNNKKFKITAVSIEYDSTNSEYVIDSENPADVLHLTIENKTNDIYTEIACLECTADDKKYEIQNFDGDEYLNPDEIYDFTIVFKNDLNKVKRLQLRYFELINDKKIKNNTIDSRDFEFIKTKPIKLKGAK